MTAEMMPASSAAARDEIPAARTTPLWRKLIPYLGTVAIFALIFWRIPVSQSRTGAVRRCRCSNFLAVFLPYSLFYCAIDSALPHLGGAALQRADALSRHPADSRQHVRARADQHRPRAGRRRVLPASQSRHPFSSSALSSILFIALLEIYQLFLFSTLGVIFYTPVGRRADARSSESCASCTSSRGCCWSRSSILFAIARRKPADSRLDRAGPRRARLLRTFIEARPLDYATVLGDQGADLSRLGGRAILRARAVWDRDAVREADAVSAAGVPGRRAADRGRASGTSQAAWLLFFSGNASAAKIRRLQPRRAIHLHVVQRPDRTVLPAAREPRADRTARRTRER